MISFTMVLPLLTLLLVGLWLVAAWRDRDVLSGVSYLAAVMAGTAWMI